MFLGNLNTEEKKYFWSIINHVAACDNEVSHQEQLMLEAYKNELNIELTEKNELDLDETLLLLKNSSEVVKKSILIETIALVMSDDKYHKSENELVMKMVEKFGIKDELQRAMFTWVENMKKLYSEANYIIGY